MFKESFKYYKSKNPRPTFDDVLDFDKVTNFANKVKKIELNNDFKSDFFGVERTASWKVYEIVNNPGLLFIKNPFTCLGQKYWAVRCLQDYSLKPNKSNLDALKLVPENRDWWDLCKNNSALLQKMRWITLGYHHDWDSKIYTEENKNEFPQDLADLTSYFAKALGFSNFNAEAAIVNYYHLDSTLSGHTDHSEMNLEAPLFSFSLGQTAVFLLGGRTKDIKPTAIFLRSGDVVVMSKESRLCYHGVPKIVQDDYIPWDEPSDDENNIIEEKYKSVVDICKNDLLWKPFGQYLSHCRININIRQVLKRGQKRLNCESDLSVK